MSDILKWFENEIQILKVTLQVHLSLYVTNSSSSENVPGKLAGPEKLVAEGPGRSLRLLGLHERPCPCMIFQKCNLAVQSWRMWSGTRSWG